MTIKEIPIDSPIGDKIRWAENCYEERRDLLLGDEKAADLLKKFKEAALASHREMAETTVLNECRDCEERDGGSCCGAGLENRYSGILLLINLLLGRKIVVRRHDPQGCFFLGREGCTLLARDVICVNYLCKKITDRIDPKKIAELRKKEGIELELLFFLYERIKKILNKD